MSMRTIGNLHEAAVRDLASTIKIRTIANRVHPTLVYVDGVFDVYVVRQDSPLAIGVDAGLVGTYNHRVPIGDIAADLLCARDEELAKRRAA